MSKWRYYKRKWLNLKNGRAFSIACVGAADSVKYKDAKNGEPPSYMYNCVETYLELGDCSQDISLDFSFHVSAKGEFEKQVDKLDRLVNTIQEMRAAMILSNAHLTKEYAKYEKAWAKHEKKKNEK